MENLKLSWILEEVVVAQLVDSINELCPQKKIPPKINTPILFRDTIGDYLWIVKKKKAKYDVFTSFVRPKVQKPKNNMPLVFD